MNSAQTLSVLAHVPDCGRSARCCYKAIPTVSSNCRVPFAPGGTTDIVARTIADPWAGVGAKRDGKTRPEAVAVGANGNGKAAPDGYSILAVNGLPTVVANPAIIRRIRTTH